MTDDHDRYRDWAAAYVLGSLEPAERADYERHLRDCSDCRHDVNEFAPIPGLLAQVDPSGEADDTATARLTDLAVARANHDYASVRASTRRWRWMAIGSAAAAVVAVVALAVGLTGDDPPDRGVELPFEGEATGSVHVDGREWGTWIWLDLAGLPARDRYQLWAIDRDGAWVVAASWQPTPGGLAVLTGTAAVDRDRLDLVVITSDDRDDVLLTADA